MNVIYLIIDSLCFERLHSLKGLFGEESFINKISDQGISFTKMYSQAPYTEAASQAMYCGQKTLANGGHMFRFKNAEWTIFEKAKQHGMKTFYSNVLLQLHTSSTKRGVDFYHYNNGFELDGLWNYRLSYYKDLYDKGFITDVDYAVVYELLDENFNEWCKFFRSLLEKKEETRLLLSPYYKYDVRKNLRLIDEEFAAYKNDKKAYVNRIFSESTSHPLFSIETYTQSKKTSSTIKARVWKDYQSTLRKIRRIQFYKNLKHFLFDKDSIAETRKVFKKRSLKELKGYFGSEFLFLKPGLLRKKRFLDYDAYKVAPSINSFIESFIDWKEKTKPDNYFACIHVDDIHHTETFFEYDTDDYETVKKDFDEANRLISKLKKNYCGPLLYDLGIFYVGRKIEKLFNYIEEKNELENTLFVITSDHGFSYQGTPTRERNVSTFYRENYHIPAIFYYKGIKKSTINGYYNSYSIPNIIFNIIEKKELPSAQTYSTIEFMGSGCPDIIRKPIKLAVHNDRVLVCGDFPISDTVSIDQCTVYDLASDPKQSHPLVFGKCSQAAKDNPEINEFIEIINLRLTELRREYCK